MFKSQPNLVIDSGVHAVFYLNCYHQTIYAKVRFKDNLSATMREDGVAFQTCKLWSYKQDKWHFDWASTLNYIDADDLVSVFNQQF